MTFLSSIPPGLLLILGAFLLPVLRGRAQRVWMVLLPILSALHLYLLPREMTLSVTVLDYQLMPVRIDSLSMVWGIAFHIATIISSIYALHNRDSSHHLAALVYAGSAIGAVFAGDFITLFVFWEITAISSAFLIWAARTERSYAAGMRYVKIHILSGVLLLSGALAFFHQSGSLLFDHMELSSLGTLLIFVAFGIKCAFPGAHTWMQNAYPMATPTGTVFLSAYTTKLAVYGLARAFAGEPILLWIGGIMMLAPLTYAAIANNMRRVLVYSLGNQLGFMVVGIGIGTELALNGVAAHAFCHILYKGLLFMALGAVLHRVGHVRASDLGGLRRSMPWTTACCLVGIASIAAVPFFSGFVSKTMTMTAVAEAHYAVLYLVTLIASGAAFALADLRVPYVTFFGRDAGINVPEAPWNMRIAMGISAAVCIGTGLFPGLLYAILPYPVDFQPYTFAHVFSKVQILLFGGLAFALAMKLGFYPANIRGINLDTDWFYRKFGPAVGVAGARLLVCLRTHVLRRVCGILASAQTGMRRLSGPSGIFARTWSTGGMVLWAAIFLALYLLLYFLK